MKVVIVENPKAVGAAAAQIIATVVLAKPRAVLGFATGSSPGATYRSLATMVQAVHLDFSEVRGFALDEYVGIPRGHPASYAEVIRREIVEPLGLTPANVSVPDGQAQDLDQAGRDYEEAIIEAGGIDIQILGIGANGHIGFNEPTSSLTSLTRIKTLTESTRRDNARFFDHLSAVPVHCLTQGLGTILRSHELVLVAHGSHKAVALAAAVEGPLTSMVPASVIQLHSRATVIVDEEAASLLTLTQYYRFVASHLP
ncbi:MAG: glucosamine-6-phosphate deaminase [Microbacteriaceae bacterium]|nr:glucosamine-6-phosphate deaminase [Microbacteriaceae bacterium]